MPVVPVYPFTSNLTHRQSHFSQIARAATSMTLLTENRFFNRPLFYSFTLTTMPIILNLRTVNCEGKRNINSDQLPRCRFIKLFPDLIGRLNWSLGCYTLSAAIVRVCIGIRTVITTTTDLLRLSRDVIRALLLPLVCCFYTGSALCLVLVPD